MTYIPLEPVKSSMISRIGYHQRTETLRIEFHDGAVYDYPIFTQRDWDAFQAAESVGKYFHTFIKPMFGYGRVTEAQLKEPCCDHPADADTCDESCFPCDPKCCPGITPAQHGKAMEGMVEGLSQGRRIIEGVRAAHDEEAC